MSDKFSIRPVVKDDFPRWKPLWDGYNAFYGRAGPTALPLEVTQMTWSRFFDAYEPMHALVAEASGRLLGLVHFLLHRSTIQIAPTLIVLRCTSTTRWPTSRDSWSTARHFERRSVVL